MDIRDIDLELHAPRTVFRHNIRSYETIAPHDAARFEPLHCALLAHFPERAKWFVEEVHFSMRPSYMLTIRMDDIWARFHIPTPEHVRNPSEWDSFAGQYRKAFNDERDKLNDEDATGRPNRMGA